MKGHDVPIYILIKSQSIVLDMNEMMLIAWRANVKFRYDSVA